MLSRKHYRAVAKILNSNYHAYAGRQQTELALINTAGDLATYFQQDNAHFDRDKFFKAIYAEQKQATDYTY
jgi:hypothetical protein